MRCTPTDAAGITLGVDIHKDFHVALDGLCSRLGTLSIPTTRSGYEKLAEWANGFGPLEGVGIEGTGSFGAGLTRFLRSEGTRIFEVDRPKRRDQYRSGKSDPIDAELAAGAVLARTATGRPKDADGEVEMIRALRVTRRSAVKARAQATNQLKNLLITAPEGLRSELCGGSPRRSFSRRSRALGRAPITRTWRRPPSSPCARWRAATNDSPKRSPNWTSNWIVW